MYICDIRVKPKTKVLYVMEQDGLINEKRIWLFEQIKSEYAAMAKGNRLFFWIFCTLFGLFLIEVVLQYAGVLEPFSTKEELSSFIFYAALLLGGLYNKIAANKMAKADTPENLLVTYDKMKKIGVATCIVVVALLVISVIIKDGFGQARFISWLLFICLLVVLFFAYNRNNQIKKLRELVQKS